MKRIFLLLSVTMVVFAANAQRTVFSKVAPLPNTSTPKEGKVSGFEAEIAQGNLTLIKAFQAPEGKDFVPVYSVTMKKDNSFNNGKPLGITLSQGSFDAIFSRSSLSSKKPQVAKYITDHNISLTDEKGWVAVVKYYNGI